jgi:glycosyltransferase involved in cell wall biosynthesis
MKALAEFITEAFAYSKPVIALRSGATPELIKDKHNGFLYVTETDLVSVLKKYSSAFH